jgi:hypothetical protein
MALNLLNIVKLVLLLIKSSVINGDLTTFNAKSGGLLRLLFNERDYTGMMP